MTDHIRDEVLSVLTGIAPEVEPADIDDAALLRDQVDLDSRDGLNFLVGVHTRLGVEIPEADYRKLRTLGDVVTLVSTRAGR